MISKDVNISIMETFHKKSNKINLFMEDEKNIRRWLICGSDPKKLLNLDCNFIYFHIGF